MYFINKYQFGTRYFRDQSAPGRVRRRHHLRRAALLQALHPGLQGVAGRGALHVYFLHILFARYVRDIQIIAIFEGT